MRDVEHGVSDTGRGIWATIRENPVPAGMVGVGVAWLLANRRSADEHRHYEYGTYSTGPAVPYRAGYTGAQYDGEAGRGSVGAFDSTADYGSRNASSAAGSTRGYEAGTTGLYGAAGATGAGSAGDSGGMREKASDAIHQAGDRLGEVQERVGGAMHDAQERVGGVVHDTQERVSSMAHQAKYRAQRAEHRMEDSMRENPVAAGAVALAIGMAAGLMIPETEREHRMLGRTRERAMDKAGDVVRRSADKLHDAAREAAGESARHAVDEVWPGGDENQTEGFSEPRR